MAGSVVFVSAVQPSPPDSGKKVVVSGFLSHWSRQLGRENVHLVLVGHEGAVPAELPAQVHRLARPPRSEQLVNLGSHVLLRRRSIQEALLHGRALHSALAGLLATLDADVEVYDTVRFGQYLVDAPRRRDERRLVYLDDLFSVRYSSMLQTLRAHPEVELDVLGDFADKVPSPLRKLVSQRRVQAATLALESRLIRGSEQRMVRVADRCLLVSETESQLLRTQTGGAVATVPPLVPEPGGSPRSYDGRPEFVLLGLLSLPHNHDGAIAFLDQVMPGLLDRLPQARIRIVGRDAADDLRRSAARYGDSVRLEGFVPDLDKLLSTACAVVNPLRFGSGIKIKVLQALARGLPVVSTAVGAEGIVSSSTAAVEVAPLEDFPRAMTRLTDVRLNRDAGAAARALYEERYSPAAAGAVYDRWLMPAETRTD